jgi:uncharacterized protein HemY
MTKKNLRAKATELEEDAKRLKREGKLSEAADIIKKAAEIWHSINQTKHYYWCMANFHSWKGEYLMRDKRYKDASEHFREAITFFKKVGLSEKAIYYEAHMYESLAFLKKSENDYKKSAELFFIASERFRSIQKITKSLWCEMHAWGCLGRDEMNNENFLQAKKYFRLACAFAEVLNHDSNKWYYLAKYYECEYQYIRNTREGVEKLPEVIEILEKLLNVTKK